MVTPREQQGNARDPALQFSSTLEQQGNANDPALQLCITLAIYP